MIIRKLIENDKLKMHWFTIPGAKYLLNHAYKEEGEYVIFAGELDEGSEGTEIVVHTHIGHETMAILQIILSAGQKLDYKQALLQLIQHNPDITMAQMCEKLHVSASFIETHLRLPFNREVGVTSLSNLYMLAKVKEPSELLRMQARVLKWYEFGPLCVLAIKEARIKKAKAKAKK